MSVLILGDVHIGKNINLGKMSAGASLNSRISDQLCLLDWTLDKALDSEINDIIITGDIFEDPKPHPQIITLFISWLKKCQANNVKVHIVAGNHDILRTGNFYISALDIISECEMDNIFIYKDIDTVIIDNAAYTFMPFRDRKSFNSESNSEALSILHETLKYEWASIPLTYKKIIVGHLAIEGSLFIGDEVDDISNELFCPVSMFENFDYVWMGHVHKFQVLSKKTDACYVAHIGSMDISNFGESEQTKKIAIVSPNSTTPFEYIDIPNRGMKKISILIPDDAEDATKYCLDEIEKVKNLNKNIVKVDINLPANSKVNKKEIEKLLEKKGVYSISSFSESKKISMVKKEGSEALNNKINITSGIKHWAETQLLEEDRADYIELANEINTLYESEIKS